MDKRAFAAVPRPAVSDAHKEMAMLAPMEYLVTAGREEIAGEDTLIMNFFHCKEREFLPAFRTFCQMEDYISQDLSTEKIRWKTGAVDSLTVTEYMSRGGEAIAAASPDDRRNILGFLQEFRKRHGCAAQEVKGSIADVEREIEAYQMKIKSWRLRKKHEKEIAVIDNHMEKFGELPENYGDFVKDTVFAKDNYIFYNRKQKKAYCSSCGHTFRITASGTLRHEILPIWNGQDKVKHNGTAACPFCGKRLQCKSEGRGRGSLFAVRWSVLLQKQGEAVLVRYFRHTKDFRGDFHSPKIETCEMYRTIHTAEKALDFEWGRFKNTGNIRWCFYRKKSYGYCMPSEMEEPRSAVLYNRELPEAVSGTCMKYSAVDIYVDKVVQNDGVLNKPWCIDWYFNAYRKKPFLEQLLKVGFYRLVEAALNGCAQELENGRTVLETLGLNRQQFRMLRQSGNPPLRDWKVLRHAGEISREDFDIVRQKEQYGKYLDMRRYTTIFRLEKYLHRQAVRRDTDYFDYIGWLEEMGYDMRNTFNLYPKNFRKAHDEKAEEYTRFKEKQTEKDRERFCRLLEKFRRGAADMAALDLRLEGLFIRLPETLDELKREGETLHHCVATYAERVAKGETMIFFIRKETEPEKPYFTLEWKNRVIQCRGQNNCDMTPEVRAFIEVFQEKIDEWRNAPKTKRKAG